MILRLALGVALTAALLSVSAPALSTARADAADATVERQLSALAERLGTMVAIDSPTRGPGARRVVTVNLPADGPASAAVAELRFHTRRGVGFASWRVRDASHTRRLVDVPIRPVDGPFSISDSGGHRLVFALELRDGRRVVTVRRLNALEGEGSMEGSAGGSVDA
ncbi:DUF7311 family protein [Haloarcula nitratireducens]|uniref:DUF7311 domain-containing protein n=1 Tax=Haloarcula nitratireducens TaxID=2487749 RepID=A0AAW4P681_9EURY|nr:hypothetical protein [Halomicroarcula nitratireducens]MBX0293475.1 hypothetical protein [Halomicroarcula nitratireducens]